MGQPGCHPHDGRLPMMVASWEVHEVIKLLLGKGDLIRDRMLLMDAEAGFAEIICFTS